MTSLGVGMAVMLRVARVKQEDGHEEIGKIIKAGLLIALSSGGVLISIAWLCSSYAVGLFFSKMGLSAVVENVFLLGVILLALQQLDEVLVGALRGMQRFDLIAKVEIYGRPVWVSLLVFTAYHTEDVVCLLSAHLVYIIMRMACRAFVVNNFLGRCLIYEKSSLLYIKELVKNGKWIAVQSVGGIMFSTLDRLCVGGLFGAEGMTRYTICTQISQFVHNFQAAALQIIAPWVAKKEKQNLLKISVLTGVACLVLPLVVMMGSGWILRIWIGVDFADKNSLLLMMLMLATTVLAFTIPAHFIVLGLGKVKACAVVLLLGGCVALAGSLIATIASAWGLLAFVLGRLLYGIVTLGYLFVLRKSRI